MDRNNDTLNIAVCKQSMFATPVKSGCTGYLYLFLLTKNIIQSITPSSPYWKNFWISARWDCGDVNRTGRGFLDPELEGPADLSQVREAHGHGEGQSSVTVITHTLRRGHEVRPSIPTLEQLTGIYLQGQLHRGIQQGNRMGQGSQKSIENVNN